MDKVWVAYLVPKMDLYLVVEDGLGFIARGPTQAAAEAALHEQFVITFDHYVNPIPETDNAELEAMWNEYNMFSTEV